MEKKTYEAEKAGAYMRVMQPTVVNESKPYDVEYLYRQMRKRYAGPLRESHVVELVRLCDLLPEMFRMDEPEGFYDTVLMDMAIADVFYEVLRVMTKRGINMENIVKDMMVKMTVLNEGYPDCVTCGKNKSERGAGGHEQD